MIRKRPFSYFGFEVPELGLGTWALGGDAYGPLSPQEALQIMELAFDAGISFFDTADFYGFGESEKRIGNFLKKGSARKSLFLATKGGLRFEGGPVRKDFSYEYLISALDNSLVRLGRDTIDLYQLHGPQLKDLEKGECLRFLREAKKAGKIRFAGVSLHEPLDMKDWIFQREIDAVQLPYNLINRRLEDVAAFIAESKKALIIREIFASGFLSGRYSAESDFPKGDHRRSLSAEQKKEILEKMDKLVVPDPAKMIKTAIHFSLRLKEISTALLGVRSVDQLKENLAYYEN